MQLLLHWMKNPNVSSCRGISWMIVPIPFWNLTHKDNQLVNFRLNFQLTNHSVLPVGFQKSVYDFFDFFAKQSKEKKHVVHHSAPGVWALPVSQSHKVRVGSTLEGFQSQDQGVPLKYHKLVCNIISCIIQPTPDFQPLPHAQGLAIRATNLLTESQQLQSLVAKSRVLWSGIRRLVH